MRHATITLTNGEVLSDARVAGAGNGADVGLDLYVTHTGGQVWVNTEEIASIVWSCGKPNLPEDADEWCGLAANHDGGCGTRVNSLVYTSDVLKR